MPSEFLNIQAYENIVLAQITKERLLDAPTINTLAQELTLLLDRYPKISLVLDLAAVDYLSSAMLGKLVALYKGVKTNKGRMAMAGVKPALMPLFKVTQLDKLMEFFPEAKDAIFLYKRKPL
jgi:anti-sigma B factor antagonist